MKIQGDRYLYHSPNAVRVSLHVRETLRVGETLAVSLFPRKDEDPFLT